jgi:sigma-54 dependent transcriptional regulator, acetoin dehydrogenase operon transcriptional activator AcoR
MSVAAEHVGEIERVLNGGPSGRDPVVIESWRRCVSDYGLDPTRPSPAYIVSDGQLREHREQSERLIAIARTGLERLFRQVAGQNYVLLLADRLGVTVDFFGDPAFESELRQAGLYLGSDWSEDRTGTCGVGACIVTGQPMTIHQTDHFDLTHTPLSCTAAPIFDTGGALAAVLDISLLRSPQPKISQNLALHLVSASARRIELANLMATMRQEWVLRLAHSPEFLDVDPEAAIALDASGRILGTTHGAAQLLARVAGVNWRAPEAIVGQLISRFFEVSIDDLPSLTRGRPSEERLVALRDGSAVFAHAIAPTRMPMARRSIAVPIPSPLRALSGEDPAMRALEATAAKLAKGSLPILIRGETGTGKERLARAIHASRPEGGPFVAVNCAAIPEALIEGELFGHAAGAFSGALARGRAGLIEAADGGVLFLDEIGDMPLQLQARLLRVLSEGEVTRLGEAQPRRVRTKVISATNRDLAALVAAAQFREDLFYRLVAATLTLPPLRERIDFEWLLERLVKLRSPDPEAPYSISPAARLALIRRPWPGNLRELVNVLDVAIALADNGVIEPEDLPEPARPPASEAEPVRADGEERDSLAAVLRECDGNVSQVARRLGVDRSTVHRRMRRFGLSARS